MTVPPYCGVPRLSHQFPVDVVLTVTVVVVDVLAAVVAIFVEVAEVDTVVVDLVNVVELDVVVDLVPQDASTIDVTMRKIITIQIVPLFICTSLVI
jgi:hypothetical protein